MGWVLRSLSQAAGVGTRLASSSSSSIDDNGSSKEDSSSKIDNGDTPTRASQRAYTRLSRIGKCQCSVSPGEFSGAVSCQSILASSNTGLWVWEMSSGEVEFCDVLKRNLGYSSDSTWDLAGFCDLTHPDDAATLTEALTEITEITEINSSLSGETPSLCLDLRLRHKDGRYISTLTSGTRVEGTNLFAGAYPLPPRTLATHTLICCKIGAPDLILNYLIAVTVRCRPASIQW